MMSNELGESGQAYVTISARIMELALQHGIEAGLKSALEYMEKERKEQRKGRYDRRLRNTRLLLKNYRTFKDHVAGAVFNTKQIRENAIDILDGLDDTYFSDDSLYIESIKKSQQRTMIILKHIDQMLRYYQIDSERSDKEEEMRRYRIIMATYIDDERRSAEEIAYLENVEKRTVYKDITAAIKPLSALIFGIDSLKLY